MKKLQYLIGVLLLFSLTVFSYGNNVTRSISINYLPDSAAVNWLKETIGQNSSSYRPAIALNYFSYKGGSGVTVGTIYSRSGKKVETLVSDLKPVDILGSALTQHLEKVGFKVIPTSSWNLSPKTIPTYLNADFIIGGNLTTFWVESRSGFLSATVDSQVNFDLFIADVQNKEIIWTGQISGHDIKKTLAHTNDYFWTDLQNSISRAFSEAVNQVLKTEQTRKAIITSITKKL